MVYCLHLQRYCIFRLNENIGYVGTNGLVGLYHVIDVNGYISSGYRDRTIIKQGRDAIFAKIAYLRPTDGFVSNTRFSERFIYIIM